MVFHPFISGELPHAPPASHSSRAILFFAGFGLPRTFASSPRRTGVMKRFAWQIGKLQENQKTKTAALSEKLEEIGREYPLQLPPYFVLILRAFGTLEV